MVFITERQEELLKVIVEEYVKEAKPVSSKSICDILDCSSATIRSEMSNLEKMKFLEKTHISSGRVPSAEGYRYYVDNLMEENNFENDILKLDEVINNKSLELTDVITESLLIISEITNYTSMVLGSQSKQNKLKKLEVVKISDDRILLLLITDQGHVENRHIRLDSNINPDEIKKIVELINKMLTGVYIDLIVEKLEEEIKPIIKEYVIQYEMIYNAFYNAFSDLNKKYTKKLLATNNLANMPEFNDALKIRKILNRFEDENLISDISENKEGINIYIGDESKIDNDVTVIKMPYLIDGEKGTIAIIGPKRMEYNRVVKLLEYLKDNIERE